MPSLSFSCPYTSREGHCPKVNGWSFHHILPVRYYWTAAFILVKLIRLLQCRQKGASGGADLKAEFGTKDALALFADFDPKRSDLAATCLSLHNNPAACMAKPRLEADSPNEDLSDPANIASIVFELTGPRYGGFTGPAGSEQRVDDPGSGPEPKKPAGFTQAQWDLLEEVSEVLERCMSKLASNVNGPYQCTLSADDAKILLHSLRTLKNDYGTAVYDFKSTDWKISRVADWYYLDESMAQDANNLPHITRQGQCGKIFYLGDDSLGGQTMSQSDFTHLTTQKGPPAMVTRSTTDRSKLQFFGLK